MIICSWGENEGEWTVLKTIWRDWCLREGVEEDEFQLH